MSNFNLFQEDQSNEISRSDFLKYIAIGFGAIASISPIAYFLSSNNTSKNGYGSMPYGGKQ